MAFIDGPWDMEDFPDFDPHSAVILTPPPAPVLTAPMAPTKTAYTTVRILFKAGVQPGSTVSDGYDLAKATEVILKDKIREWLGAPSNVEFEVFVQTDIR